MESKGTQAELSALGFTEENAKAVTASILLNEKEASRDRLKAAEMTFKVHGTFQPESTNDNRSVVNIFNNPTFEVATRTYEQSLKEAIRNETPTPIQAQDKDD